MMKRLGLIMYTMHEVLSSTVIIAFAALLPIVMFGLAGFDPAMVRSSPNLQLAALFFTVLALCLTTATAFELMSAVGSADLFVLLPFTRGELVVLRYIGILVATLVVVTYANCTILLAKGFVARSWEPAILTRSLHNTIAIGSTLAWVSFVTTWTRSLASGALTGILYVALVAGPANIVGAGIAVPQVAELPTVVRYCATIIYNVFPRVWEIFATRTLLNESSILAMASATVATILASRTYASQSL